MKLGKSSFERRQMFSEHMRIGAIYAARIDALHEQNTLTPAPCHAYKMHPSRALNIDEEYQLALCETMMRQNGMIE